MTKIEIKTVEKGAELTSVLFNGEERIHDAKTFWGKHAPILFPTIGNLRFPKVKFEGEEFPLTKHGFGRDLNFEKLGENSYVLKSNEQTHKMYPYDFELYVWHEVDGNKVTTNFRIKNTGKKTMLFGLGGHPAFKCDYSNGKCQIEFEVDENDIELIPFDLKTLLLQRSNIKGSLFMTGKKILKLDKDSFKNDAMVLSRIKSKSVILKDGDKKLLKFNFDGFNYLGVWSQAGAPFVCLEPWYTTADYVDSTDEFKDKKDVLSLEPGKEFVTKYSMEFY